MSSPPTVRLARPDEIDILAAVLADAFDTDPFMRYLVPDGGRYHERLTALFVIELKTMIRLGATWVDDHESGPAGVAVWAPPDRWRQRRRDALRNTVPALRIFGRSVRRVVSTLNATEKAHPRVPAHWYLGTIGTATSHQGRGVGGRLLRAVLDRCDAEQIPAYLETSKVENRPYYERFGFETRPAIPLAGDAPSLVPMWRDPQVPD